jgi:hypothetical protein
MHLYRDHVNQTYNVTNFKEGMDPNLIDDEKTPDKGNKEG